MNGARDNRVELIYAGGEKAILTFPDEKQAKEFLKKASSKMEKKQLLELEDCTINTSLLAQVRLLRPGHRGTEKEPHIR